jgi:RNA polymerase sigma-70 factor (ECF subfamily)
VLSGEVLPLNRSDEELLLAFRGGDKSAFGALLRRYEREMYGYLRRYLGDAGLAEDVFQNTFLQVYLKSNQFEEGRQVRPWLYTIATNQAVDTLRRNGRRPTVSLEQAGAARGVDLRELLETLSSRDPGPLEAAAQEEQREQVRAVVEQLPDLLKQTLVLTYYQGLKYREVAEILGIPVGTVKSRLHAALVKLHEIWTEQT